MTFLGRLYGNTLELKKKRAIKGRPREKVMSKSEGCATRNNNLLMPLFMLGRFQRHGKCTRENPALMLRYRCEALGVVVGPSQLTKRGFCTFPQDVLSHTQRVFSRAINVTLLAHVGRFLF